ncbi:MAG: hypothetical protein IJT05_01065 [Lachnospiraceae bacterium]|nr:hypothetical protein [Lachnospiraceae bacterium]
MKQSRKGRTRTEAPEYVYGNAVPDREYEIEQRKRKVSRELAEKRAEEERKLRRVAAIRRNQARELSLGWGYVVLLTVLGILISFIAVEYIRLQTDVTVHLKRISQMESQLEEVRADNAAIQKRIDTATDLKHIKDVAMSKFGMNYAGEDQIVYYTVDNADYMNQYAAIPE